MANISAADISKLRLQTGAGMMDCKNALEEADGDAEKAAEILRKRGIVKAAKRAEKIAVEGEVKIKIAGNKAIIVEVNSETDFVSKNDDFKRLVDDVATFILQGNYNSLAEASSARMFSGVTLQDYVNTAIAKIGEKIVVRRFALVKKEDSDVFGFYNHMNGKIGVIVCLSNTSDEILAREISMHAAATNPKVVSRDQVPEDLLSKEKEVYLAQLKNEGKPENIIENILKGKMNKFCEEICLLEQTYVKDETKKVAQLLPNGVLIKKYIRYELGEGIEKTSKNFADEVSEQL